MCSEETRKGSETIFYFGALQHSLVYLNGTYNTCIKSLYEWHYTLTLWPLYLKGEDDHNAPRYNNKKNNNNNGVPANNISATRS